MGWQPFGKGLYATVDVGINAFLEAAETAVAADAVLGNAEIVCDVGIAKWAAVGTSHGTDVTLDAADGLVRVEERIERVPVIADCP